MAAFDPDLDTATFPSRVTAEEASEQQRLMVNPLLAVVGLAGVWALFRYSLEVRNLGLFLATLFAAVVSTLLVQYHCLDCGRTDFAIRSSGHACTAVVRRVRNGEEPPRLPPAVRTQVKAWLIAAVLAFLLLAIFSHAG